MPCNEAYGPRSESTRHTPRKYLTPSDEPYAMREADKFVKGETGKVNITYHSLSTKEGVEEAAKVIDDLVNSPKHYKFNEHGIECIEAIQASLSADGFKGYLKGNIIKYMWRYEYKGKADQDLAKAHWYLTKLRSVVSGTQI